MHVILIFPSVYVHVDVLNYGTISHTVGVFVSGCIHTHLNLKLECIRHFQVYVEIADVV